jgi:hypothetical protein
MRRSKIDYAAWDRIGSELQKRFGRVFKADTPNDDDTDDDRVDDDIDEERAAHRKRIGKDTMNRSEQLRTVVKRAGGIMPLCKAIATTGRSDVSEHELVSLLVTELKRAEPDLSDAQAFAKAFGAATPQGEMLRQAVAIAKAVQLEIMPDATEADRDDSGKATRQKERLVDEQIRRSPEMTRSQAWNVVVHENPMLAATAIRRPVANEKMLYPFPK